MIDPKLKPLSIYSSAAKNTIDNIEKVGAFYIVHSNSLIPIFKKFKLYQETDKKEISLSTFSSKFNDRKFRSSLFNGFSANFMAILFE